MKLHYYRKGNFGDDINAWLWERLLPGIWDDDPNLAMSGIGTIISNDMPQAKRWVVCGSGVGYNPPPDGFGGPGWDVLAVRGPLSAKALDLPPEKAGTDGAILLSCLPDYQPLPEAERHGVVFMPHHQGLKESRLEEACRLAGIAFIHPAADDRETIGRLRAARLVIADAMHAAIVADALRVPWVPVATSPQINGFKWLDWTLSMGLPYEPIILPPSSRREALRSFSLWFRGERFFLKHRTVEAALKHFRRMRRLKERVWWLPLRKSMTAIYTLLSYGLRFFEAILPAPQEDPYLLRTAEALKQAAAMKGLLSDASVFEKKRAEMMACVEKVRQLAQAAKAPEA